MNVNSDIVFANQCDRTEYEEYSFDGHKAKMISTETKGVGINRNLTLMYASADICLFSDDDMLYVDNLEEIVLKEFELNPDADVIIFNLDSEDTKQFKPGIPVEYEIAIKLNTDSKASLSNKDSIIIEPQHPISVVDSLYSKL
jgi:glycosyltransferase involved in cell wall biosynthesis